MKNIMKKSTSILLLLALLAVVVPTSVQEIGNPDEGVSTLSDVDVDEDLITLY